MSHIYISYCCGDSLDAGEIRGHLSEVGFDVRMDVYSFAPGSSLNDQTFRAFKDASLMIVVVGRNWLNQLKEAQDTARIELESALQRGIPIIPVLVDGAIMPDASELPESLQNFACCRPTEVGSGRDFEFGMMQLTLAVSQFAGSEVRDPPPAGLPEHRAVSTLNREVPRRIFVDLASDQSLKDILEMLMTAQREAQTKEVKRSGSSVSGASDLSLKDLEARTAELKDFRKTAVLPSSPATTPDIIKFGLGHPRGIRRATSFVVDVCLRWLTKARTPEAGLSTRRKTSQPVFANISKSETSGLQPDTVRSR
jgi:TIR domain